MATTAERLCARLIRNFDAAQKVLERRDPLYETACARLALGTAATKLGVSIDIVPPGKRACPYHFHCAQEEMFIVLEGRATLRVADELLPLVAGDIVFIPPGPDYPHQIINDSNAPLKYLSISTKESPELVEYPDSGKYLVSATRDGDPYGFARMHRDSDDLDYWDGEP
ncbi:MAG: cupin domain-containing protein [Burkholderiaceae bacterium]